MSIKNLHLPKDEKTRRGNQIRVGLRGNYRTQWGEFVVHEDRLVEILEPEGEVCKIHESGVNLEAAFFSRSLARWIVAGKGEFILPCLSSHDNFICSGAI